METTINKSMEHKINIDDFLTLIYWIKTFYLFEGKPFNYQNLLDQAETNKIKNIAMDTDVNNIDGLMIDAYQIYNKLKTTKEKVLQVLDTVKIPSISKNMMLEETKKYEDIFEYIIENFKYNDIEIIAIQKGFLLEKLKEYVASEEYEKAAKVRDIINEC